MKCAYCGKEAKGTKEHIISCGVLDLFPECFETIDGERHVIHQSDPMVKDVCSDCNNNKISYIDSYAKKFIEKYFLSKYKKDDTLNIEYDYLLLQKVCLKYAYNDMRSRGRDISFFDNDIKSFIMEESKTNPLKNITLLAGLAVNTSPLPDYVFGNTKLRWGDSPIILKNSIVMNIDYLTGKVDLREEMEQEKFKKLAFSYVYRFNSLQILMFCWSPEISNDELHQNKVVLDIQYPYQELDESGKTILSRCTGEVTYHFEKLIDVTWGQNLMDEISLMRGTFSDAYQKFMLSIEKQWNEVEKQLEENYPR